MFGQNSATDVRLGLAKNDRMNFKTTCRCSNTPWNRTRLPGVLSNHLDIPSCAPWKSNVLCQIEVREIIPCQIAVSVSGIPSISRTPVFIESSTMQAIRTLKIFLRQPFTQSSKSDVARIQSVMDVIKRVDGKPYKLDFLTAPVAESEESFKLAFETTQHKAFTPFNFRNHRLGLLKEADAFIIIKTSLSESTSFEVAYNIFGGRNVPMLFAIHENSFPIKTTLLRELDDLASHVEYVTFKDGEDLQGPVQSFLKRVAEIKKSKSKTEEKSTPSPRPTMVTV